MFSAPMLERSSLDKTIWFLNIAFSDTLSYTPTCILMFGIFIAYFITIVIFAGLYLTVNKVGSPTDFFIGSGAKNAEATSSFCGMDINNHMEGK